MDSNRPRIGLIGLGIMGSAMASRLLQLGWPLTVWNLEPERMTPIVAAGASAAGSPREVAEASDLVLLCVLDRKAVDACVFGAGGVAESKRAAARLLIDLSTISPDATSEFAKRLGVRNGMHWVDAPVSGGPLAAEAGTLTIMAGGDPADYDEAKTVLDALAQNCNRVGTIGAGQAVKIVNQAIVGIGYVMMAEALAFAKAFDVDAAALPKTLAGGMADSTLLQRLYPQMEAREFSPPRAYARQLMKDLLAVRVQLQALDLDLPLVEAAIGRYERFIAEGNEMADAASISLAYSRAQER